MKHFYLRAEKIERTEKVCVNPCGEYITLPDVGKFMVVVRQNNGTEIMAHTDFIPEKDANKWIRWINRRQ